MTLGRIPTHALSRLRHLDHLRSRPGVRSGHTFHTGHLHRRGWSPPPRDVLLQLTRYLHGSVGSGQSGQRFQPRHSGERAVLGHARRRRYRRRREGVGRQGALRSRGHGDRGLSRSRERAAGWAVRGGDCVFRGRVAPQDSNTGAHRRHGRSAVPGNIHADERARENGRRARRVSNSGRTRRGRSSAGPKSARSATASSSSDRRSPQSQV